MKSNYELQKEVMKRIGERDRSKHLKFQGINSVTKTKALKSKIDKSRPSEKTVQSSMKIARDKAGSDLPRVEKMQTKYLKAFHEK